jgi:predicted nucleotidyltransferase
MNDQQLNVLIPDIKGFCRRYPVRELAVFGSTLRDGFDNSSDIDLLVEFEPDAQVGFLTLSKMQRELSKIFHRQVDLVPKGGLKPKIRRAVLSSARVLYAA